MDIDPIILSWILEFALKRSVDDCRLKSMLETFPIPEDNYFLRKMLLLKQLESDISRNSLLSLTTLEHLEYLEELEYRRGIENVSDAMKKAYCEVAVEYTVKYLRNEDGDGGKFCDAVKSVWTCRVRKLEKEVEKGGLGSDELFDWRLKMEAAAQDHGVRQRLVKKSKDVNAVDALRAYLKEEREGRGPSFLELVADKLKNDETLKKLLGLANANRILPKETVLQSVDPGSAVTNDNRALQKDAALSRKLIGKKHTRVRSGTCRGAKISESDILEVCPGSKCNLPPTPEVNRIQEALESSRMDLQASVKDPLPNELEFAEEVVDAMRGSTDHDPIQEDHVKHNTSAMKVAGFVRANGGNPSNGPRPSLMERNSAARTHEWDDSIENSSEESPDQGSRIKLPSPKRRRVSPLISNGSEQPKKRRRVGKWSADEEDALRTGVEECGEGSWKDILEKYGHRFADRRTQVDLKDKWRNMKRS
ncbi:telomere repeat-binding 2-like [Olea europaea subsp. europaea]|uniref:Telomere repeat-binding 2-like n=1 Tax=Olea europaea subsp. europaea TaxID=158383 RepID=A0A8S0SCZ6_OLEEU|nr:telomere repeat-binding 2-like [Olea europaea subsp. europaea]